jgi:hypothetical protein
MKRIRRKKTILDADTKDAVIGASISVKSGSDSKYYLFSIPLNEINNNPNLDK